MLRKLIDSFTTTHGSKRTDAKYLAMRISTRCTIAYNISSDETFATMASKADQICNLLEDKSFDQVSSAIERLNALGKELNFMEASQQLSERISNAYRAGTEDSMRAARSGVSAESDQRELFRSTLIACDSEYKLWSESEVLAARSRLGVKGIPSYDSLVRRFGKEKVDLEWQKVVRSRVGWLQLQDELLGNKSPCHECGNSANLTFHKFGLAQVLGEERNWQLSGASLAISALSLAALGIGYPRGPDSTQNANLLRMRLVLCNSCVSKRTANQQMSLTEKDCSSHPWWTKAQDEGFNKFIPESEVDNWH